MNLNISVNYLTTRHLGTTSTNDNFFIQRLNEVELKEFKKTETDEWTRIFGIFSDMFTEMDKILATDNNSLGPRWFYEKLDTHITVLLVSPSLTNLSSFIDAFKYEQYCKNQLKELSGELKTLEDINSNLTKSKKLISSIKNQALQELLIDRQRMLIEDMSPYEMLNADGTWQFLDDLKQPLYIILRLPNGSDITNDNDFIDHIQSGYRRFSIFLSNTKPMPSSNSDSSSSLQASSSTDSSSTLQANSSDAPSDTLQASFSFLESKRKHARFLGGL